MRVSQNMRRRRAAGHGGDGSARQRRERAPRNVARAQLNCVGNPGDQEEAQHPIHPSPKPRQDPDLNFFALKKVAFWQA